MIQTESPYFQPNPKPLLLFDKSLKYPGNPDWDVCRKAGGSLTPGCDSSWAVRLVDSSDITISGAGLYSWFDKYE
jgi:hypothetical protein